LPALLAVFGMFVAAGTVYVNARAPQPAATSASRDTPSAATRDLLNKYCVACHNRTLNTAGLQLDSVDVERVADMLQRSASRFDAPLTLDEAVRLDAHVAARREPEVACAIDDAKAQWRNSLEPLVRQAIADGTFAADVDSEAVLYFIRTVGLGLLVQRAAGSKAPDAAGWADLIGRILASIGAPPTAPPTTVDTRLRRDF